MRVQNARKLKDSKVQKKQIQKARADFKQKAKLEKATQGKNRVAAKAAAATDPSCVFTCFEMLSVASEVGTIDMDELMQGKGFTQNMPVVIDGALDPAILVEAQNSKD